MIETGTRKARAAGRGATVDKQALVRAALDEIVHNYRQANLSSVAHTYQVSLAYVSECVRAETGRTYKELLQQHRLEMAARLLRRSDLTVQQIIAQVGYENTSYFYRLFRAHPDTHSTGTSMAQDAHGHGQLIRAGSSSC